jgi:hypothetical protein
MDLSNKRQYLELHVDELVLHGFSPAEGFSIGDAIQRELERLIVEGGPPGWIRGQKGAQSIDRIKVEPVNLRSGWKAETAGQQIARCVHGGLSSGPKPASRAAGV